MDKLRLCHKEALAAAVTLAAAALVEVQPLLQEVYNPLPEPLGVNNSSQSVLPTPRQPLINSSNIVASTNIYEEVFNTFHDTRSAKHEMKSTLTSAIDDCGITDSTKVICLLDPGMKLDVDVVLNCLKGAARVTLINMLERLRLHLQASDSTILEDISKTSSVMTSVVVSPVLSTPAHTLPVVSAPVPSSAATLPVTVSTPPVLAITPPSAESLAFRSLQEEVAALKAAALSGQRGSKKGNRNDDDCESVSSNESIDDYDDDDDESVEQTQSKVSSKTVLKPLDLLLTSDKRKFVKLHKQLMEQLGELYPIKYSPLGTEELLQAVTSPEGLIGVGILHNFTTNKFAPLPLTVKKQVLRAFVLTGLPKQPWVISRSRLGANGVKGTDIVFPQSIDQCNQLVRQNLVQSSHADSTLTREEADDWRREFETFQHSVQLRIKNVLKQPFDSPSKNHILIRYLVCNFYFYIVNRSTANRQPKLLNEDLSAHWEDMITQRLNGVCPVNPTEFRLMVILLGYSCDMPKCSLLGQFPLLCYSCKNETHIFLEICAKFPPPQLTQDRNDWYAARGKAKSAFSSLAANSSLAGNALNTAFYLAQPQFAPSKVPAAQPAATKSVNTCDESTCLDFVMRNQERFPLPAALQK
jgi:hypothetical protein